MRPEGVEGSLWAAFYAGRHSIEAEFDQKFADFFEVVSTNEVDQNGDHIEQRVAKHILLEAEIKSIKEENNSMRKALEIVMSNASRKDISDGMFKIGAEMAAKKALYVHGEDR